MKRMKQDVRRALCLAILLAAAGCGGDAVEAPTGPSAAADGAPATSPGRATPGASFDWSMPARFGGDGDGDGLIDYPRTQEEIAPTSWAVDFDACAVADGERYAWHVDERRVASVSSCRYTHAFPAEGTYEVALHVVRDGEPGVWAEETVTVQDWLVVSFGDSYASGEGVPEVQLANPALRLSVESLFRDLVEVRLNLEEALEEKGLAEDALATAEQRLEDFRAGCDDVEGWDDFADCARALGDLAFDTYGDAEDHFEQAVDNAQERLDAAVALVESLRNTRASLEATIEASTAGFQTPRWQAAYSVEDWGDEDCHRSAEAAPAQAALALERSDPRTSVTFVHLACTGARIDRFRAMMRDQVPWAAELVGTREVDAVFLSIGGNDAGFADLAAACAGQQPCYVDDPAVDPADASFLCSLIELIGFGDACTELFDNVPDRSAKQILSSGLDSLPKKYRELATELLPGLPGLLEPLAGPGAGGRGRPGRGRGYPGRPGPGSDPAERVRSSRVYITEYVDMTKDDARAYCAFDRTDPLGTVPGITADEMAWLDRTAARGINRAVADAATEHGWTYVEQIYDAYAPHGYCARTHWVVRAHETFLQQGDEKGIAHPNFTGHPRNAGSIFAALGDDLYPGGPEAPPRAPDPAAGPGVGNPPGTPGGPSSPTGSP